MGDFNYSDICWKTNWVKTPRSSKVLSGLVDWFKKVEVETRGLVLLDMILRIEKSWLKKWVGNLGGKDNVSLGFRVLQKVKLSSYCTFILHFRSTKCKTFKVLSGILWADIHKECRKVGKYYSRCYISVKVGKLIWIHRELSPDFELKGDM